MAETTADRLVHKTDTPERSEAEQVAFFEAVAACWTAASASTGTQTVRLDLAGAVVDLVFAGDALVPHLTPALGHLRTDRTGDADFTLYCWDTLSTGVDIVPPPVARDEFTERGDFWGMSSARIRSAFHWYEFSLNVMDVERRTGIFWVQSERHLPSWTRASPLRTLLHWCAEASGAQLLHAAAVGDEHGAVLITGRGGVGKSSSALACLASGMRYIGDDYLLARLEPEPRVYALYCTAKLDPDQLQRFPTIAAHVINPETAREEKAVVQLLPAFASQVTRSLPLRAIATPRFDSTTEETTFGPATAVALQRAASFTTLSQLPGAGRRAHAFIERLVASVPGVTMQLGTARERVPAAISRLLQQDVASLRAISAAAPRPTTWPLISVIVPVFNGTRFLRRCVESILAQDYAPLEILIVDDGSTDDIVNEVRTLPVDVRFFRQPNGGPASARNRGIREASGDLLAFVDVDDYWPEHNLKLLTERLLADPTVQVVQGAAQVVRAADDDDQAEEFLGSAKESFPYSISAALYRRSAFDRVGLFDETLRFGEDSDWFDRARVSQIPLIRIPEVTLIVRRHASNMTRGKSIKDMATLLVFKKMLDRRRADGSTE